MRKFLNTLYVLNKDAYLSLEGENIVLLCNKAEIGRVPLHTLEGIVCFSYPGASPALMGKCTSLGVDLSFFSPQGRFLARAVGEERGNVLLRQTQYRIADSEAESCLYARNFILGKVYNARWVLERATRDHPQRVPVEQLKHTSAQLAAALPLIEQCDDLDQLRGLEGEAAQRYFDCFDSLILQQHDDFSFAGRSRRPPLDNTNALLSFAYSLLASDCTAALQSVGLDPYVGFLHRARPGRRSLALDLMEELRAVYADRFVLSCINQKIMTPKHFQKQENGAVLLTDEGRRALLNEYAPDRAASDIAAARAAGAGGGTVIHAKGTGMEGAAHFMGVELVNEKELVLIVSRTTLKNQIMQAIMQGAGPKAGAIVFSLPVTDTAGLRLLDEE